MLLNIVNRGVVCVERQGFDRIPLGSGDWGPDESRQTNRKNTVQKTLD
jgi:hypothetical protein